MELDIIRIGYWGKDPLIARKAITKLTMEQESKKHSQIYKKRRKGKAPFLHKNWFSRNRR